MFFMLLLLPFDITVIGKYKKNLKTECAAHIGMGGVKIKKEPCQRDEYVYRIS
jgi:hypothetical protein